MDDGFRAAWDGARTVGPAQLSWWERWGGEGVHSLELVGLLPGTNRLTSSSEVIWEGLFLPVAGGLGSDDCVSCWGW